MTEKKIVARECRHVTHSKSTQDNSDIHVIKEILHYEDGTIVPNVRLAKNFKRPYWIVQKGFRTFKDKKEYIEASKLLKFECQQNELINKIAGSLNKPWYEGGLRKLCRDPYIYGSDILSTSIIKKSYQLKYPDTNTYSSVAVFDIETDMIYGTGEIIIMATLSFKDKVYTVINANFLSGQSDVINRLHKLLHKYIGDYVEKRGIKWELLLVETEAAIVVEILKKAHEWKPDFVSIWNMAFDIPKCIAALERAGISPASVFCDPSVPKEYRFFKWDEGQAVKVTASGSQHSKNYYEVWTSVRTHASFYFVDAMALYYQVRSQSEAKEQSYSLNSILDKHLGIRKLNFKEAEHLDKSEWHAFMQEKYPMEYVIYNVFDCVSMEVLDETILDVALTMPMSAGCSDYTYFNSQPKRLADNMHWYCLDNNYVYGTTSDTMITDDDSFVTSGKGWIVTLPANLVADNGLCVIQEDSGMHTNARAHVGDLDVSASYPNGGSVFNISRGTTHKELIAIEGIPESIRRQQGINLSGGATNAVEFVTDLFGAPSMDTLLAAFNSSNLVKEYSNR
jgi:hypothetical protein